MLLLDVIWKILTPIVLIVAVGYLGATRLNLEARPLSSATFYVFTPCLVFHSLVRVQLDMAAVSHLLAFHIGMVVILGTFAWALGFACKWEKALCSAFILSVIMQNSGNLGISINRFAFGEHASEIAVLHYTLMQITANTIGIFIMSSGSLVTSGSALRELTKVPLIYATLLAIAARMLAIDLPMPLLRAVEMTAGAAVPIMLVILGIQLTKLNIGDDVAPISLAMALRLIIAPILAMAMATALGIDGLVRTVSVIQWGLPTAVTVSILALQYDCRPQYVAGVIFCTTMTGLLTVPMMLAWFISYAG